ncbi:MAG: GNAT family N-acetyltransferase [Planctomycetota bacterium]|nr:GNAT family N-acetyltransferase [Planctomycetota bacterium]
MSKFIYRVGPETLRLSHREIRVEDAEAVLAFNGNPEVMKLTGEPLWTDLEQTRERLANYAEFETHGFGRWGIFHKPEGQLIGFSGFKYLPELDEVDLGYRLLPEYWGRGLATESGLACLRFGFETMGFERLIALVLPENAGSMRVVEKIGMHNTGPIQIDDETAYRFAAERPDWLARHTS